MEKIKDVDTNFFYTDIIYRLLSRNCKYQLKTCEKIDENKIVVSFLDGTIKILEVK
jgi:hypothetical protein